MLGHQSFRELGRPPVFTVGESIAGFSLSLPWAVAESCMTGQPASALRSTPWGLSGAVSWSSGMGIPFRWCWQWSAGQWSAGQWWVRTRWRSRGTGPSR